MLLDLYLIFLSHGEPANLEEISRVITFLSRRLFVLIDTQMFDVEGQIIEVLLFRQYAFSFGQLSMFNYWQDTKQVRLEQKKVQPRICICPF